MSPIWTQYIQENGKIGSGTVSLEGNDEKSMHTKKRIGVFT